MVIKVLSVVRACNTAAQGALVAEKLRRHLRDQEDVTLSFEGVSDVPSSFINASIVALMNELGAETVTSHLTISSVTNQIAGMIRRCINNNLRGQPA